MTIIIKDAGLRLVPLLLVASMVNSKVPTSEGVKSKVVELPL